jgi:heptaprenylglyceryl phosphate synthase
MSLHHFTLIVDGPGVQDEARVDALFEAGCDDALVGGAEGIQYVTTAIRLVCPVRPYLGQLGA